jgi:soluble lytic murein transglycosylase
MRRILGACLLLVAATITPARAQPGGGFVPAVLSAADVTRYRQIIANERAGKFAPASDLIAKLDDKSLIGYIEAEKILSPRSKRSSVATLVKWLKTYGELPIAPRIHKLAVQRATKKVRRHHRRVTILTAAIPDMPGARQRGGGYEEYDQTESPVVSDAARAVQEQIIADIKSDDPDSAYAVLQSLAAGGNAPSADIAKLTRRICTSYLIEGKPEQAYQVGDPAAEAGRADAPLLDWCAGLAAFQLGKYADAAHHFDALSAISAQPATTRAGAAFWAARSFMRAGDNARVIGMLNLAAGNEPTFYGLLAERLLGMDPETGFADPSLGAADFDRLMKNAPTHRAVALWQIAEKKYQNFAVVELNRGFGQASKQNLEPAYAYLARKMGSPNIELRASEISAAHGLKLTGLFPIPQYKPLGGYTIDSALVLAFVRAETRFIANAVSPVGAVGLMQMMPGTARRIGGKAATEDALLDPEYNMTLGQRNIAQLLNSFGGNLVKLAAGYNAGPGKVGRWQAARDGKEDDPLMFIESMKAPETRSYVKRLMTYYWMYYRRNGNPAPSLEEAARGEWPIYHPPAQTAPPPPPAETDEDDDDDDDEGDNPTS